MKSMKKWKILIVEDNEINVILLENMLKLYPVTVDTAVNAKKAMDLAKVINYDLVFLDYMLPDKTGDEVARQIRSMNYKSKTAIIIALSANIDANMQIEMQRAGVSEICPKPIDIDNLERIIRQYLYAELIEYESKEQNVIPEEIIYQNNIMLHDQLQSNLPLHNKTNKDLTEGDLSLHDRLDHDMAVNQANAESLRKVLRPISEIDFDKGIRYALGNYMKYLNIISLTMVQVNKVIVEYEENLEHSQIQLMVVHNLCSLLANVGAIRMSEEARVLENKMKEGKYVSISLTDFMKRVKSFSERLSICIEGYKAESGLNEKKEEPYIAISNEEYEHIFSQIIYYIKMYDYDSIVEEIERLIIHTPLKERKLYYNALEYMKNYEYENVLEMLENNVQQKNVQQKNVL